MALFNRHTPAPDPPDPGLQQIDEWLKAYTDLNTERLRGWPDGPLLDAERATVAAQGTATVAAMRAEYLARSNRS